MAQATVSIRVDTKTKKEMEQLCSDLGMNLSTAVNMFFKQSIRDRCLPFLPKADPYFTDEDLAYFDRCAEELRAGGGIVKTLEELESMTHEDFEQERQKLQARKQATA